MYIEIAIGIPTGILADKIGKEKVLTIGYAVFVISSLLMVLFTGRGVDGLVCAHAEINEIISYC